MSTTDIDAEIKIFLKRLVNIESVCGMEEEVSEFLEEEVGKYAHRLQKIPLDGNRKNLLASIGEGEKTLCFNAHADTVTPHANSFPVAKEKGGKIYGLGACDDKASLTSMFFAWRRFATKKIPLKLDFLISVDEEIGGRGVLEVVNKGYRCDFAVVGEPTNLDVVIAHSGILWVSIKVKGKSSHGSSPWKGINAIQKAIAFANSLEEALSHRPSHQLVGKPSLNIGYIRGGKGPNIVPEECEMGIDIRVMPGDDILEVEDMVRREAKGFGAAPNFIRKNRPFIFQVPESALVKKLSTSIKEVTGRSPRIKGWRGWAESGSFIGIPGIQTVVFGPGRLDVAHSDNEWVQMKDVISAERILTRMVKKLAPLQKL